MQNIGVTNKEHYGMSWHFLCPVLLKILPALAEARSEILNFKIIQNFAGRILNFKILTTKS